VARDVMENPLRGIVLSLGSTLLFSLSDATAKFLTGSLPAVEIAWIRYVVFVGFALALAIGSGPGRFRVRRPGLQVARGLGLVASSIAFIFALHYLPLADATAIGFVSPLLTAMLAVPILGEVVGMRRWVAAIIGLVGVIVVVRPGTGAFHPAVILVLLSSLSWAVASVLTRMVAGVDSSATTLLWSAGTGALLLSVALPFDFVLPTPGEFLLLLVLGVVASTGHYLTVLAYRHAAASVLAPFSYSQLIWATALGFLVFGAIPDFFTFVGAGIIVGSGIYSANYERGVRRRAAGV
jgi:drug/metabolite transporter (DMT)-like permease